MKMTVGGIAIGVGVAVAVPFILPILASIVKPLTKAAIKGGLMLYKTGEETLSEAKEAIEHCMAEAKSEMAAPAAVAAKKGKKAKAAPGKPNRIAKAIMGEGRSVYDKGKSVIVEAREAVEQLVEEARSEIAAEAAAKES